MSHHDPAADSAGVWVVTELPAAQSQLSDSLLFPDGFAWPASDRKFTPLFPEDNELLPQRDAGWIWIERAMRGVREMHQDEAARKEVADRLF